MSAKTTTPKSAPARNSKQDWFECDSNLSSKPEIKQIRRNTGCDVATIVGRLVMLWSLVDQHGDLLDESERPDERPDLDGIIPGYAVADLIEDIGGDQAFWNAVIMTGWLAESRHGLLIPGFDRRFSTCSKQRAAASRRKMRQRQRDKGVIPTPAPVTPPVTDPVDETTSDQPRDEVSRDRVTSVTRKRDNRTGQDRTEHSPPPSPAGDPDAASSGGRSTEPEEEEEFEEIQQEEFQPEEDANPGEYSRTSVITRPPPTATRAAVSADVLALRQRLLGLGITAPHIAERALEVNRNRQHLDAVLSWMEQHPPIETPDGTIWAIDPGAAANRITQPGRAAMPPGQGISFDPDWLAADRRRRDRQRSVQRQTWDLVKAMKREQLEQQFGERLAQADQSLLRSRLLQLDAGTVILEPRELRDAMLRLLAVDVLAGK